MMKTPGHQIELSRWDEGAPFCLSDPFRSGVRRAARAVTFRGPDSRSLFHPQTAPADLFEGRRPWFRPRAWCLATMLALQFLTAPATVWGQVTNSAAGSRTNLASRVDFSSFRIIADRNIFNSTRSGRSARSGGDAPKPAKVDSFTLVGTMAYEKGRFAFFDGSGSEFRKVLKPDGVIAGYKVLDIAPGNVKLGREGKELDLRVGTQMRRQDDGDWQQSAEAGSYSGSGRETSPAKAGSNAATASDSGGADNDVLKRLMQKREAEENK